MWKPETIHRRYNEKLGRLLLDFESKLRESLDTGFQGVKSSIKDMVLEESGRSGIATAYVLYHRTKEFDGIVEADHPVFGGIMDTNHEDME